MMPNYHPNHQMSVFKCRSQIKRHFLQLQGREWWLVREVQPSWYTTSCGVCLEMRAEW